MKRTKDVAIFLEPVIYSLTWIIFLGLSSLILPKEVISNGNFLIIYTLVFLFALITKSTFWSIGHEKFGITGDSRSRLINYHWGEDAWFDLFGDKEDLLKEEKTQKFILDVIDKKKVNKDLQ